MQALYFLFSRHGEINLGCTQPGWIRLVRYPHHLLAVVACKKGIYYLISVFRSVSFCIPMMIDLLQLLVVLHVICRLIIIRRRNGNWRWWGRFAWGRSGRMRCNPFQVNYVDERDASRTPSKIAVNDCKDMVHWFNCLSVWLACSGEEGKQVSIMIRGNADTHFIYSPTPH